MAFHGQIIAVKISALHLNLSSSWNHLFQNEKDSD